MIRILSIEILLAVVFGAILYRVAWTFTRNTLVCWSVVLLLAAAILLFVPGHIDQALINEFGCKLPPRYELTPLVVNLLRCLGLVVGAGLASLAVTKRRKLGLEDKPPYDDFP
ncbi:MAG: hypothetical protein DSZ00_03845 [Gammaproteobacteria bacterium]|nr:MAG: hypothetical protein DSZ02_08815 [Gammaproteobacteria bacterium]RTZ74614.1 MAG: hypothetical protein DSZ00_03845 [Gammaproteobacteria bacterium]RTZ77353.1 MAG: hypothetical protein DSZ01_06885 [Gammaproteobacteria bacterium]